MGMIVLAEYPTEEILPSLGMGKPKTKLETPYGPYTIKVGTKRLECLRRNQSCVWCGKTGTFFRLERSMPKGGIPFSTKQGTCYIKECPWCSLHPNPNFGFSDTPHLNLYYRSKRGGLFLMTQDHILPRSRGGKDVIENLQTMCSSCNSKKGNKLDSELNTANMPCAPHPLGNHFYVPEEALQSTG